MRLTSSRDRPIFYLCRQSSRLAAARGLGRKLGNACLPNKGILAHGRGYPYIAGVGFAHEKAGVYGIDQF